MAIFDEEEFDGEDDEFAGYTVVDENAEYRVKVSNDNDSDEETIASPIPENEIKVLLDSPQILGADSGDEVSISGLNVLFCGNVLGNLKPAFLTKLNLERGGQFAYITLCDADSFMIKFEFNKTQTEKYKHKIG